MSYSVPLIVLHNEPSYCANMPRLATASSSCVRITQRRNVITRGSRDVVDASRPTLLWIDDFAPGLEVYSVMFQMMGYRVLAAASGAEGIRLALSNRIDIVVTDYEMPGLDGETVAVAIKTLCPHTPIVLFSGSALVPSHCRRVVDAICDKARSRNELLAVIHRLLHKKRARALQPPVVSRASENGHRTVA